MKYKENNIAFSHMYEKLKDPEFHTVRWPDSVYYLGHNYNVDYVASDMFHRRYSKGKARLMKMKLVKIKDLPDEFIKKDADCTREEFMKLMSCWYSKKPSWAGEESEVQVLYFKWVTA